MLTLYSNGLSQFQIANQHLSKFVFLEGLLEILKVQSQQAMEMIHVLTKQIMTEVLALN